MDKVEHVCNKEVQISEIHNIVTKRAEEIKEIRDMLSGIDKALRGNGSPGLFTDLAVIRNTVGGLIALDIIIVVGLVSLWLGK